MNIVSVIGTRPQYIKIKPIFDFCKKNNINHKIIDTRQHYSYNVSGSLIEDLGLNIDEALSIDNYSEIGFLSNCIEAIGKVLSSSSPDIVLVYGDTNSTFCAALAAYKLKIPIAHIEAGERCFDMSVPEEVNRVFVDGISKYNFCSSDKSLGNVSRGTLCGDLEYELLNSMNPKITYEEFGVMTVHRDENTSEERIRLILDFCASLNKPVKMFAHHRTKRFLQGDVPKNVIINDSCPYSTMVKELSSCSFVITDSGSIQKTSAFFGKKTLVMRSNSEWKETEEKGFCKLFETKDKDLIWLKQAPPARDRHLYAANKESFSASSIIFKTIGRLGDG